MRNLVESPRVRSGNGKQCHPVGLTPAGLPRTRRGMSRVSTTAECATAALPSSEATHVWAGSRPCPDVTRSMAADRIRGLVIGPRVTLGRPATGALGSAQSFEHPTIAEIGVRVGELRVAHVKLELLIEGDGRNSRIGPEKATGPPQHRPGDRCHKLFA